MEREESMSEESDVQRRPAKKVKLEADGKKEDQTERRSISPARQNAINSKDCNITLAVDVSGSTRGRVLDAEQRAIINICSAVEKFHTGAANIVPWDHQVFPAVSLNEIAQLASNGGTCPSRLCSSSHSVAAFQKSSLWFLMTDGNIEVDEVHRFANAVPNIQLHGTACVIIIFGRRPEMPKQINISVGYSMFTVAPHCLLLFHDILTDDIFAIRAKGCFESLIPEVEDRDNEEEADTEWAKVPRITYQQLGSLSIPKPLPLSTRHIALSNGDTVDMDDLLNNRVPANRSFSIIASDRDRETIVGTAASRGQGAAAREWLQSHQTANDRALNRSISHGLRQERQSNQSSHSALDGLSESRTYRVANRQSNLSTASTLVGTRSGSTSSRTVVGDEEVTSDAN